MTAATPPERCQHRRCDGELIPCGVDRYLPGYIERLECRRCGEWYLVDEQDGTVGVDA